CSYYPCVYDSWLRSPLYHTRHVLCFYFILVFLFKDPAPTEIYTLSLHDALPISSGSAPLILLHGVTMKRRFPFLQFHRDSPVYRSEEHTSELQSLRHLVCRLLLEKKKVVSKKLIKKLLFLVIIYYIE